MKPVHSKFYLLSSREKEGKLPIYLRISANRKKTELFTGFYADPSKWDESKERLKGNVELNAHLSKIKSRLETFHLERNFHGITPTLQEMKSMLQGNDPTAQTILSYFEAFILDISKLPDQYTKATLKKYATIKRHLYEFLESIDQVDLFLSRYNLKLVNEFDFYLRSKANLSTNTTAKYLKQFKAVFNRAIQFGFISQNPFLGYKFKQQKTNRTFLSSEEIKLIEELPLPNDSLSKVRDCFIFAIYSGLRYSDVCNLTKSHLKKDSKGNHWLEFKVQKTRENTRIPLLEKAAEIVLKYENFDPKSDRLLPTITHQKVNTFLKIIGSLAGIEKNLTFHVARHTFATTVTLSNEIPIEIVSKLLGHSSLASTQVYAKITSEYLLESNQKLNKILSNEKQ